jgi:hypothetical protein
VEGVGKWLVEGQQLRAPLPLSLCRNVETVTWNPFCSILTTRFMLFNRPRSSPLRRSGDTPPHRHHPLTAIIHSPPDTPSKNCNPCRPKERLRSTEVAPALTLRSPFHPRRYELDPDTTAHLLPMLVARGSLNVQESPKDDLRPRIPRNSIYNCEQVCVYARTTTTPSIIAAHRLMRGTILPRADDAGVDAAPPLLVSP